MVHPLPNISDIFDQVGDAQYFTVIDCVSGFHQILLDEEDAYKTAFSTPNGHFEFVRMPFGLRNAAVDYQRAMNITLAGLIGKGVFVYMDDIVIYAKTLEEHERLFNEVMKRLREANWKLEPDKCELLKKEVVYLGHVISKDGLNPDPRKVEAVMEFPRPTKVKNVRQFLGLAGYYRRFIKNFAKTAKPLTKLLQNNETFQWTEEVENAFQELKNILCSAPLLQFPDMTQPFIITTDASGYASGGVLSQGKIGSDKPIAYTSRVFRGPELKYEVYEKEALAMIHAVKTFRPYVFGKKFTIVTDHQPLVWFKSADLNTRVLKWRFKLSEYDYEVVYKPGRANSNADALSRNPVVEKHVNVITRRQKQLLEQEQVQNQMVDDRSEHQEKAENKKKRGRPKKQISAAAEEITDSVEKPNKNDKLVNERKKPTRKKTNQRLKADPVEEVSDDVSIPEVVSETEHEKIWRDDDSNIDSFDSDNSFVSIETGRDSDDTVEPIHRCNLVETKELIERRSDNIVYMVDVNGTPLDEGAKKLVEANKIPPKDQMEIRTIKSVKKSNNKYNIALCIRENSTISQFITLTHLHITLTLLKDFAVENNLSELSIAKSNYIENIPWTEIRDLIITIFKETNIKIIICKGTLEYVDPDKRDAIFYEVHKSALGGHRGISKTYNRLRQQYFWDNMKPDIQRRIQQCLECQIKKLVRNKTKQPMVLTDTPGTCFDKVALDVVGPLPKTKNDNEYILTMQDQLSKYCIAVPLPNALARTIADAFVKRLICTFGTPRVVLTDQGRNFLSKLLQRIAKRFKIKQVKTTAFHPQSNGSLERSHHALAEFLKQYSTKDCEWDQWLEIATFNYNKCVHESTKHTPFEVVFGRLAREPSSQPLQEGDLVATCDGYIKDLVVRLTGIRKLVYDHLINAKMRLKSYYDRHLNPEDFKVGDYVFFNEKAQAS